ENVRSPLRVLQVDGDAEGRFVERQQIDRALAHRDAVDAPDGDSSERVVFDFDEAMIRGRPVRWQEEVTRLPVAVPLPGHEAYAPVRAVDDADVEPARTGE